jgi:hypothetical protein
MPFKPAENYSINLLKSLDGTDGVTAVGQKTAKYIEYALKVNGHPISDDFKVKVPGSVLNGICSQATINRLVKEYNTPPKGQTIPEYERLPALTSKEVSDAIKAMLPTMKL